jgi:hypothetical protein
MGTRAPRRHPLGRAKALRRVQPSRLLTRQRTLLHKPFSRLCCDAAASQKRGFEGAKSGGRGALVRVVTHASIIQGS